jgi:hypothetical protein
MKLSFKKQPKNTGLSAIGNPFSVTDIKIDGKRVGLIDPPNWSSKNKGWIIRFVVRKNDINEDGNPNCTWRWITLVGEYKNEELAREYLKENIGVIAAKFNLCSVED